MSDIREHSQLQSPRSIFLFCVLGYLVLASYAVARPAVESLFLSVYSSEDLPRVWIAVAIGAVFTVGIYNRFAASRDLIQVFRVSVLVSMVSLLALLGLKQLNESVGTFLMYVWKDIYIVVLVETFWSLANTIFQTKQATKLYGIFCVAGSLGGMSANLGMGPLAKAYGTDTALLGIFPILGLVWFMVGQAGRMAIPGAPGEAEGSLEAEKDSKASKKSSMSEGLKVLRNSPYLGALLALICLVQVVITLVDYQFNAALEDSFPDTDARTGAIGKVYAAIDMGSLFLQLLAGPIIAFLGVSRVLLMIPIVVGMAVAGFALTPSFLVIAVAKVSGKCFDYSLFRAAKEMLYIPLSYAEKTQGKAVVDILTYRVAKGGASLLLMAIIAASVEGWVAWLCLGLVLAWILVTTGIVKRYALLVKDGLSAEEKSEQVEISKEKV